jgi:uroporphyrinogen decarboxylase
VGLNPPSNRPKSDSTGDLIYDEWGVGRRKVLREDGGYYFEMVEHPLSNASLADLEDYPWPDPYDPARREGLREKIERIREESDKAVFGKFGNSIWEQSWWLRGMEQWMMDLVLNPEICTAIMAKTCQIAIGFYNVGIDVVGDLVDVIRLRGEDLGTQRGPMISLKMYDKLVKPHFQRLWSITKSKFLKKNPAGKLMLHSCGTVIPFIHNWIEMGLDILDPIQPRAKDMEPEKLKADFGKQLVFHGGIDIQHTLPFGTPEEVRQEVRRYIQALGPGGGYIVAPAHNVQGDVSPENLVAMRDAVEAYGQYPIT